MKNNIGAVWSKWDLHVHTPLSAHHRFSSGSEDNWEKFIQDLEHLPKEFKVIGINDYYFIDGYKKVLEEKQKGRLQNIDLFLPVVELRIDKFSGNQNLQKINYHIIFSDEVTADDIEKHFISTLRIEFELESGKPFNETLSRNSLENLGAAIRESTPESKRSSLRSNKEIGFKNLVVKLDKVKEALENHRFKDKFLLGLGKTEWDGLRWDGGTAPKRDIISKVDFLFCASENQTAYDKARFKLIEQNVNSNLLDCSDAHTFSDETKDKDRVGNCNTWIKSEKSFNGLKHTLREFDDRVFVGDIPEKLKIIGKAPSCFLSNLQISKKSNVNFKEKWFNQEIELNPDLVSIIGNKGSGKSALADIIGLVGDTRNYESFSFLEKRKFREPKSNPSQYFSATGTWLNNVVEEKGLDQSIDLSNPERVKYIPQNHLEELCNELGSEKESEFEKELKKVIFSHIDTSERLGKDSLDALIKFKTEQIEKTITILMSEISDLNSNIITIERRLKDEFKSFNQKALSQKEEELKNLNNSKPDPVNKPETDPKVKESIEKKTNEIEEAQKKREELEESLKNKKITKSTIAKRLADLKNISEQLDLLTGQFNAFTSNVKEKLLESGVNVDELITFKSNKTPLAEKIARLEDNILLIDKQLQEEGEDSISRKISVIDKHVKIKKESLDAPNQEYQKYKSALKEWEDRKKALVGSSDQEGTIEYFKSVLALIKTAPLDLENLERQRDEKSKQIYGKIKDLVTVYQSLYKPVQEFIRKFDWSKEMLELNFEVDVVDSGFEEGFFSFILQSAKGSFYGQEPGRILVRDLLSKADLSSDDGIVDFVREILHFLRVDKRGDKESSVVVENQLRKGKNTLDLYNFLTGLEFLRPRYVLKVGDKELPQLSPGERGLLLLVFYLLVDRSTVPIVIDQPEGNLDNQTIKNLLVPAVKDAKKRRQVFLVTHNPNLAVVCDSEQVICASLDKVNGNEVTYTFGGIENSVINEKIVDILEGTWPAFDNRQQKYVRPE